MNAPYHTFRVLNKSTFPLPYQIHEEHGYDRIKYINYHQHYFSSKSKLIKIELLSKEYVLLFFF